MYPALNPQILDVGNGCKCYFDDERECYVVFHSAVPKNLVAEVESMQEAIAAASTFTPESDAVPISALPCLTATTAEFSSIIREWLTADQLAKVRAGNADVDDFCDANMAMLGAVEKMAPGFELDSSSTEQSDFFEKVWTGAKQARYCNHIQEQLIDEHHAYNATTIEATNRLHSTSSSSEKNCRPGSFITEPCFPLLQQNILGSPNVRDS